MIEKDLNALKDAYDEVNEFYPENLLMLPWYASRMIATLQDRKCKTLLSLGIGYTIVGKIFIEELAPELDQYWIIDGSTEMIEDLQQRIDIPRNVQLVHEWFERFSIEEKVDAIDMGFILEHVDDPLLVLQRYAQFIKPTGSIFITVPNARSLHRLIGFEAGLLGDLYQLSQQDIDLGHQRYFDMESLTALALAAGLEIVNAEGIFLKPIATSQIKTLGLSPEVLQAFLKVGVDYPEISNCIYMELKLPQGDK